MDSMGCLKSVIMARRRVWRWGRATVGWGSMPEFRSGGGGPMFNFCFPQHHHVDLFAQQYLYIRVTS